MTQGKHAILTTPRPAAGGGLRLSWAAAGAIAFPVAFFFGVVTAFGTVQDSSESPVTQSTVVEQLALQATAISASPDTDFWIEDRFERGDTFATLLERLGVDDAEADRLRRAAAATAPLRWLRPGTTVQAKVNAGGGLQSLWFIAGRESIVTLERRPDGSFVASEQPAALERHVVMKSGEIRSSLFAATDGADIPDSIATQIAEIFAGDVDFHRDLRRGDRFSVVYEMHRHAGREVKSGRVLAAEFVNNGKTLRAVWYPDALQAGSTERGGYFTPEGKALRKAFLRSPLEFSRITSGFGMRMHPIQQRWRAHKGVDYAAPSGTRVRATGDGMVEFAGPQGGYGNLVVLRHPGGFTTWYAHLSGFPRGLSRGARVSQADVIGFVGSTGWATGPHLHYEFRANGEHRNPLTIAFPAAQPLTPDRLPAFLAHANDLAGRLDLLRSTNLALLE